MKGVECPVNAGLRMECACLESWSTGTQIAQWDLRPQRQDKQEETEETEKRRRGTTEVPSAAYGRNQRREPRKDTEYAEKERDSVNRFALTSGKLDLRSHNAGFVFPLLPRIPWFKKFAQGAHILIVSSTKAPARPLAATNGESLISLIRPGVYAGFRDVRRLV